MQLAIPVWCEHSNARQTSWFAIFDGLIDWKSERIYKIQFDVEFRFVEYEIIYWNDIIISFIELILFV